AVSAQGLREALALGEATGTSAEETLDMLGGTGLALVAGFKGPFVRGDRSTAGGDLTANAIAKDARLMIDTVEGTADGAASDDAGPRPGADLPALRAALASLDAEIAAGHGEDDFSTILLEEAERTGEGAGLLRARPLTPDPRARRPPPARARPRPAGPRARARRPATPRTGLRRGGRPPARCARAPRRRRSRSPRRPRTVPAGLPSRRPAAPARRGPSRGRRGSCAAARAAAPRSAVRPADQADDAGKRCGSGGPRGTSAPRAAP